MRTWRERRQKEYRAWDTLMQPLADAYTKWKYCSTLGSSTDVLPPHANTEQSSEQDPQPDEPSTQRSSSLSVDSLSPDSENTGDCFSTNTTVEYSLIVYELFGLQSTITVDRPPSSISPAINIAEHGFLAKTPVLPNAAIGFKTLELFHRLRLRKASFSVEAFTRVLCDYYMVCGSRSRHF